MNSSVGRSSPSLEKGGLGWICIAANCGVSGQEIKKEGSVVIFGCYTKHVVAPPYFQIIKSDGPFQAKILRKGKKEENGGVRTGTFPWMNERKTGK